MEMLDERRSKILFSVALGKRASKFGASVHTPEADEYVNAAWLAFLASGLPMPEVSWVKVVPGLVADWIDQCLEHDFVSVGTSPNWLDEPTWRFEGKNPMRFVGCIEHPVGFEEEARGQIDTRALYLFEGETQDTSGMTRLVYKLVAQESGSPGTAYYPD